MKGKESGKHEHKTSHYSLLESQNGDPCAMLLLLLCHQCEAQGGKRREVNNFAFKSTIQASIQIPFSSFLALNGQLSVTYLAMVQITLQPHQRTTGVFREALSAAF